MPLCCICILNNRVLFRTTESKEKFIRLGLTNQTKTKKEKHRNENRFLDVSEHLRSQTRHFLDLTWPYGSSQKGQFNTKGQLPFSPIIPHFHTKNPSGSPLKKKLSKKEWVELRCFWCRTEECVELRGFWLVHEGVCGTEGFLVCPWGSVWDWGVFGVELRGCVELIVFLCGTEGFWVPKSCGPCVELMCWTVEVCVELRGTPLDSPSHMTSIARLRDLQEAKIFSLI